jgi:membrane-bound serine protease (ClpP class)
MYVERQCMKKICLLLCLVIVSSLMLCRISWATDTSLPVVSKVSIKGAIGPAMAEYVVSAIKQANEQRSRAIVLTLDTPGGLVESARSIIQAIQNSHVPVIAYVTPRAARAASAGTFILYASHIAAMSPVATIGAATPVSLTGGGEGKEDSAMQRKVINSLAAEIRVYAQEHGRNVEWSQKAVKDADSITTQEAKKLNVINFVAENIPDLLKQVNGHSVKVMKKTITLDTSGCAVKNIQPDWRMQFLMVITDPNVAYILLLAGMFGVTIEFFNPGMIIPGIFGLISLCLAAYGLSILPVNFIGLGLIVLAVGLFITEVYLSSFGFLGVAGVVSLAFGSLMLIQTDLPGFGISTFVVATTTVLFSLLFGGLIFLLIRDRLRPSRTGDEHWEGRPGVVKRINQEYWFSSGGQLFKIQNTEGLTEGQSVVAEKIEGAKVIVQR